MNFKDLYSLILDFYVVEKKFYDSYFYIDRRICYFLCRLIIMLIY